jgi:excisionase family DNA binding protein
MSEDEILTIREVAALLKIGEKTAYTMAQEGQLPGFKVRGQWRFRRADIDQWIARRVDRGAGRESS